MTNITLSIEDEVYKKMKYHSEIKWSEFVRKAIKKRIEQLNKLKDFSKKWENPKILADKKSLSKTWLSKEEGEAWGDL